MWQLFIIWCTNHLQIFKVLLMYTWQCLESILKLQPSAAEFNEKLMHICYEIRRKICTPITCEIEIIITPLLYPESDNDQIFEMCCKKHVKTYFLTKTYCIFFLETQLWWWFYHIARWISDCLKSTCSKKSFWDIAIWSFAQIFFPTCRVYFTMFLHQTYFGE